LEEISDEIDRFLNVVGVTHHGALEDQTVDDDPGQAHEHVVVDVGAYPTGASFALHRVT
jgi:hypothetical protein